MKKVIVLGILIIAILCASFGVKELSEPKSIEVIVSAASSLKDVIEEIGEMYKKAAPNVKLTFVYGSSGALQVQIEEGAPIDIFMSASKKQMADLEKERLIKPGTKKELLENKIVLITGKDRNVAIKSFEDCGTDKVRTISLGQPESVPVGQYSEQVFTALGILDRVKEKAKYGTDVRQVLSWVESGESDCGVVYATDAAISKNVNVICEAPASSCEKVIYPVAVLERSKVQDEAEAFLSFLATDKVVKVFEKYGFVVK